VLKLQAQAQAQAVAAAEVSAAAQRAEAEVQKHAQAHAHAQATAHHLHAQAADLQVQADILSTTAVVTSAEAAGMVQPRAVAMAAGQVPLLAGSHPMPVQVRRLGQPGRAWARHALIRVCCQYISRCCDMTGNLAC
jgi:hypothetical protein